MLPAPCTTRWLGQACPSECTRYRLGATHIQYPTSGLACERPGRLCSETRIQCVCGMHQQTRHSVGRQLPACPATSWPSMPALPRAALEPTKSTDRIACCPYRLVPSQQLLRSDWPVHTRTRSPCRTAMRRIQCILRLSWAG